MGFRKSSQKYVFDVTFYLVVLGFAALIVGVPYYAKKSYDRSRGREVQALLEKENLNSIEAYRKQAGNWVNRRAHGMDLSKEEREKAEEIVAQGLFMYQKIWMTDRMNSVSKEVSNRKQDRHWEATLEELDSYLESIGEGG